MKKENINKCFLFFNIIVYVFLLIYIICCIGCTDNDKQKNPFNEKKSEINISITDSLNNTISFSHPVTRIITTSTYATEYLIALGADDAILGVNSNIKENLLFKGYLNNSLEVGTAGNPDIEKIISLHPDVVILPFDTSESVKSRLKRSGIKILIFDFYSLDKLSDIIQKIGKITDQDLRAEKYLQFYQKYNNVLSDRLKNMSNNSGCRVYYEMSGDYSTSGKGSGGYNYLQKLKANNIAENLNINYPVVSPEWIISENPDVVIKLCDQTKQNNPLSRKYNEMIKKRSEFGNISAGNKNRIFVVSTNVLYGPRVIIGLLALGKVFYPDRFADIDPDSVLEEYSETFFPGANKTEIIFPDFSGVNGNNMRKFNNSPSDFYSLN